jgi:hypothetical protein
LVSGGAFLLSDTVQMGGSANLSNARLKWVGEWDASKHLIEALDCRNAIITDSILLDNRDSAPLWTKQMMYVDG